MMKKNKGIHKHGGKTRKALDGGAQCHLLPYRCLGVAANLFQGRGERRQ